MKLKFSHAWKFSIGIFALLNLLFVTGNALALPSNGLNSAQESLKVVDGSGPTAKSSTTFFHFLANELCSKVTEKCIEISGNGSIRRNDQLKANGHFMKYDKEGLKNSSTVAYHTWNAKELVNSSAIRVHFKATAGLGNVDIAVTEGKTPNSGLVCVWGTIDGITGINETLCTNKVLIYIS
jgi:hypothetical protein